MKSLYPILFIFLCHIAFAQLNTIRLDEVVDEHGYSIHGVKHITGQRWILLRFIRMVSFLVHPLNSGIRVILDVSVKADAL